MAEGGRFGRAMRRRVMVPCVLLLSVAFAWAYDRFAARSILVEADTGTLRIVLAQDMEVKSFPGATLCRRRPAAEVDLSRSGAPLGCPARSHVLIPPDARDTVLRVAFPKGTELLVFSERDRVSVNVLSVPEAAADTAEAALVGGGFTLRGDAVARFGSLALFGPAVIGSAPVEADRLPVIEGSYQINGTTLSGLLLSRVVTSERTVLRQGELRSGAQMHFHDRDRDPATILGRPAADARLQIAVPNPASGLMRVTAISDFRPVDLVLLYYRADPVVVRSSFFDILAADPVILLIATLGSAIALLQLRLSRPHGF